MSLLIQNIGRLATPRCHGSWEVEVTTDAAILVEGETIAWVGKAKDAPSGADETHDAQGGVATPGLVDAHTHLGFGGSRYRELELRAKGASYQEVAAAGGGILSTVRATRELSPADLEKVVSGHRDRMALAGTTLIEGKSGYGLSVASELGILDAYTATNGTAGPPIVPTYLAAHAVPPEYRERREAYFEEVVLAGLPEAAARAQYADMFVEKGYFEAEEARRLADAAKTHGLGMRLHVDQFGDHGGAALAAELGAKTADHLEHTGPDGIAALAKAGVVPVLLPLSVLGLGLAKYPDAPEMMAAGLPVVLASDFNPGSSPGYGLPLVMALAARYLGMTPHEALVATTVNAAASLGSSDRGVLAPGKRADICLWPREDERELAYWLDPLRPTGILLGGRQLAATLNQSRT
ncbi:MAG: imidazolonepropionase [Fimbriimonadaceae bacterium]|nr:imidazolonepropionase [Fimbriimonadaceae bacterium]QYK56863.1 MAG: imidazolonepropionase [Fimbriimonadaceae bacterium]